MESEAIPEPIEEAIEGTHEPTTKDVNESDQNIDEIVKELDECQPPSSAAIQSLDEEDQKVVEVKSVATPTATPTKRNRSCKTYDCTVDNLCAPCKRNCNCNVDDLCYKCILGKVFSLEPYFEPDLTYGATCIHQQK